jgi:hypothetical protein
MTIWVRIANWFDFAGTFWWPFEGRAEQSVTNSRSRHVMSLNLEQPLISRAELRFAYAVPVRSALDRTISDIEMRLAAARGEQMRSQGVSPASDSVVDQGNRGHRMFFVMGIMTTFHNRKRRDSLRQTWMPQGTLST